MTQLIADSLSRLLGAKALPRYPPICPVRRASFCLEKPMKYTTSAKLFIAALIIAFIACSAALYVVVS